MKRFNITTVVIAVLLLPAILLAADSVRPGKATLNADNTITVPLEITNGNGLMAIDMPLSFSEGVTLKEVNFAETRVDYFDLKISSIDNEKHTVVIGLISQASAERKDNLAAGEGVVANLVFEITDPSLTEVELKAIETEFPHHSMTFIYLEQRQSVEGATQRRSSPTFNSTVVALSSVDAAVPQTFGLDQNYPNPFNPTTEIAFSLAAPSQVNLTVYNLLGQEVRALVDEERPAGSYIVTWDGTNSNGSTVASGVYFYRLVAGGEFQSTRKMLMLK